MLLTIQVYWIVWSEHKLADSVFEIHLQYPTPKGHRVKPKSNLFFLFLQTQSILKYQWEILIHSCQFLVCRHFRAQKISAQLSATGRFSSQWHVPCLLRQLLKSFVYSYRDRKSTRLNSSH